MSLTHKGKIKYKTSVGSTFTVVTIIISLTYFIWSLVTFINQSADQTFKSYPLYRDLYDLNQSMDLNNSEFNVAFGSVFT